MRASSGNCCISFSQKHRRTTSRSGEEVFCGEGEESTMCAATLTVAPVVSKIYCSSSQTTMIVRKRPHVANGGGFVVTNVDQMVVFSVEGCGTLGTEGELLLRDGDGAPVLFIRKRGGVVQAVSISNHWRGYLMDYEGIGRPVFSLKEQKQFFGMNAAIKISTEPTGKGCDFEVKGSFKRRACSIIDREGNVIAKVAVGKGMEVISSNDIYHVIVQPGYDQAFVIGVIAVLDNIYGESTAC